MITLDNFSWFKVLFAHEIVKKCGNKQQESTSRNDQWFSTFDLNFKDWLCNVKIYFLGPQKGHGPPVEKHCSKLL